MEADTIVDIEKIITDLTQQHNLDIAITEPEFNEEKKDYKKVVRQWVFCYSQGLGIALELS